MVVMGLSQAALATTSSVLSDYGFNVDGTKYWNDFGGGFTPSLPSSVNTSSFDLSTGLGTVTATINGVGNHYFLALFNHDLGSDYTSQSGLTSGTAATVPVQSWQIGDADNGNGAIYTNFKANTLSDTIDNNPYDPANSVIGIDLAMAMGWNFTLLADQSAYLTFSVSDLDPPSFQLIQTNPDPVESLYFSSDLRIGETGPSTVPEPSTIVLFGSAIAGLGIYMRRRRDT